jgi:hypothetical protein
MAAQYFFRSTNRGDTWTMNPTDLTKNVNRWDSAMPIMGVAGDKPMASKHDGYAASSLATQVRESPSKPGVIWIGTDDGNLQLSQNSGASFTNVVGNVTGVPKGCPDFAHRAVALRSRHGVRGVRQSPQRRLEAVSGEDDGLRAHVDERRRQSTG